VLQCEKAVGVVAVAVIDLHIVSLASFLLLSSHFAVFTK